MLAEVFLTRLRNRVNDSRRNGPTRDTRFVPYVPAKDMPLQRKR